MKSLSATSANIPTDRTAGWPWPAGPLNVVLTSIFAGRR